MSAPCATTQMRCRSAPGMCSAISLRSGLRASTQAGRAARRTCVRVSAGEIAQGATVRVSQPVTVYHVPKHKAGLNLEGMEGTVLGIVTEYNGKELSANLPVKVQFALPAEDGGKEGKAICHLAEDEVEAV